ncbi:MAG: ribosome-associated translation inhibitor RaiA [Phycisphaera sp.]|nr:ribosome-associated translation inhibitor RaiA [Phycisphaera sp.]
MEITITGRHVEATDAIRRYCESKLAKLPRYYDRVQMIQAILDHIGNEYVVEVIVEAEHAKPFVCKTRNEDLYAGVDDVVDKLERQLTDHKEKLRNRKHNG